MTPTVESIPEAVVFHEAVAAAMREDENVFLMATAVPQAMVAEFGEARVRGTPISEAAVTGMAVGAALTGKRPVVNWRRATFAFNAFDQVVNQAAKAYYMFGAQRTLPIVFRAGCGGHQRMAAQHEQSPYALYAHVPGLKVVVPASPADAAGLMRSAIDDENPVVFLEPASIGSAKDPIDDRRVPLGVAEVKRHGDHVTLVAIGGMVSLALQASQAVEADGISVEVIDPRTIAPLDTEEIRESVRRTGGLIVADEAPPACSMAAEIAAAVLEDAATFQRVRRPPIRVCSLPVPVPFSPPLEDRVLPDAPRLIEAIRRSVG